MRRKGELSIKNVLCTAGITRLHMTEEMIQRTVVLRMSKCVQY
jgi:hypothetical protein